MDAPTATTGVIFLHGPGSSTSPGPLLSWAPRLIDVLSEWRRELIATGAASAPPSPIVSEADLADRSGRWIELAVPGFAGREAETWLLTEVRSLVDPGRPSARQTLTFVQRRVAGMRRGIRAGYGVRESRRRERLAQLVQDYSESDDPSEAFRLLELRRSFERRWSLVEAFEGYFASATMLLPLMAAAVISAIPIDAIRIRAIRAVVDTSTLDWIHELPLAVDDDLVAAESRTAIGERVRFLAERGCRSIVLVAHSTGATIAFAALLARSDARLPIAKLVTAGQALQMSWRLEMEGRDWLPGNPIRGDIAAVHPGLRWVDFWASYDVAASGELWPVEGCPLIPVTHPDPVRPGPQQVVSLPVTNTMDVGGDHDGYWLNDEDVLIPLIRQIDDPAGDGSKSRFYRSDLDRMVRSERRRRRVLILLLWGWASILAAIAAMVSAIFGPVDLGSAGRDFAAFVSTMPGLDTVGDLIASTGGGVTTILRGAGFGAVADSLGSVGPTLVGVAIPIGSITVIHWLGVRSWKSHDALERLAVRCESFGPPGRPSAWSEGILLVSGLVAVVLAASAVPMDVIAAFLILAALVSLGVRFQSRASQRQGGTG